MERGLPRCSQPKRSSNPPAKSTSAHVFDWKGNLIKEFISQNNNNNNDAAREVS